MDARLFEDVMVGSLPMPLSFATTATFNWGEVKAAAQR